ncbi:MAG TPA: pitrilysin family protein, partial [Gemmatimonadaceae bacterium]|nr:pitrilysin family protein [Gemmatimonadaceae bacterium]
MRSRRILLPLLLVAGAACSGGAPGGESGPGAPDGAAATAALSVPVEYDTLANGLKVVFSRDTTAPTVGVGVYYHVGFRNEPRNRTGFAHLFEHLMFQGSANLGKMEFIKLVESNGGILNGSTRFDFTNYFQLVPTNALEPILWAEADRMKGLAIDGANLQNQKDVVKNEVRVNVLNQPYGSFPWIDLPMAANSNWYNAHNFYGELKELDAATLEDAAAFFKTYYAPNNAVLVVVGDFDPAQTRAWVEKYFAGIPAVPQPARPDIAEPRQEEERRASRTDKLATRPALGVAYHVPERWTADWFAFGLLDQILAQGRDSRLYDALVQRAGLTSDVQAGINWGLGNMFNYEGPMLWMLAVYHDRAVTSDSLLAVIDREVEVLRTTPVDSATLARARTKMRSSL